MDLSNLPGLTANAIGLFNLSAFEIFLRLALSIVFGSLIAFIFTRTDKSHQNGIHSYLAIIFCPPIIATALMALGNSVSSAFGLFAALSIIRFRTPIKDIREMLYLFFCISIGICMGVGAIKIAVISFFVITVSILLIYVFMNSRSHHGLYTLRLFMKAELFEHVSPQIEGIMTKEVDSFELLEVRTPTGVAVEVIYSLAPKRLESLPALLAKIKGLNEVDDLIFQSPLIS